MKTRRQMPRPNEMQRQWQTFVGEAGVTLSGRSGNWAAIQPDLIEQGSYAAVYRVARWEETVVPRAVLEEQRNRIFSHSWDVPNDVLETVNERMVAWSTDRYGSLDAALRSERRVFAFCEPVPDSGGIDERKRTLPCCVPGSFLPYLWVLRGRAIAAE